MSSWSDWSLVAIFFQSSIAVIFSWSVLSCSLAPTHNELHELTLMKLLYLYDPTACGRTYFYNYTVMTPSIDLKYCSAIFWPEINNIAANFRSKIRVWLFLHLMWCILGVANLIQRHRPCGFYTTMVPFTLVGVSILVFDIVFAVLFYLDATKTGSELQILIYIDSDKQKFGEPAIHPRATNETDTSWIAVLFAYTSLRGVVPWFFNFWIVKDFYTEGLANHHRLTAHNKSRKRLASGDSVYIV